MRDEREEKLNKELDELNSLLDSEISELKNVNKKNDKTENELLQEQHKTLNFRTGFGEKKSGSSGPFEINAGSEEIKELIENGKKFYMKNRHSEAMIQFQKALEKDPNNLVAVFNLGIIYLEREEQELAMKQFEKALELKPDDYKSLCNLGGIYYKLGKIKEAFDILNRAIAINPNDINSIQNLKLIEKKIMYSRKN